MHDETMAAPGLLALEDVLRNQAAVCNFEINSCPEGAIIRVVPNDEGWLNTSRELLTESWRIFFDSTYEEALNASDHRDGEIAGWRDSFTDLPLSRITMDEWSAATVERLTGLSARRVVEIGAGSGMIMRGLLAGAPHVDRYLATDLSETVLPLLDAVADRAGASGRVRVQHAPAHEAARIDTVRDLTILNSVAQYLPSTTHLDRLIGDIIERTPDGGHVFIGDIRDADLLPIFACVKVASSASEVDTVDARTRVLNEVANEGELNISPCFFAGAIGRHSRVTAVEVAPRRGRDYNEMNLFRYDAVLHVGCPTDELRFGCAQDTLPNRRLEHAFSLAAAFGLAAPFDGPHAVDPQDVWDAAAAAGRTARVGIALGSKRGLLSIERGFAPRGTHYRISVPFLSTDQLPRTSGPVYAPLVEARHGAELRAALQSACPNLDEPIAGLRFVLSLDEDERTAR